MLVLIHSVQSHGILMLTSTHINLLVARKLVVNFRLRRMREMQTVAADDRSVSQSVCHAA